MRLRLSSSGKRLSRKSSKTIRKMKKTLRLLKSRKTRRAVSKKSSRKSVRKSNKKSSRKMKGGFNGTFLSEVYLGRPSIGFGPAEASPQAGGARKSKKSRKLRKSKKTRGGDRLAATQHMLPHVGTKAWPMATPMPSFGGYKKTKKNSCDKKKRDCGKKRGGDRMASTQHWASSALQPQ